MSEQAETFTETGTPGEQREGSVTAPPTIPTTVCSLDVLIEQLQAATEGSRELDYSLNEALNDPFWSIRVPADWTTSIDAALALAERVLPGCRCLAGTRGLPQDRARAAIIPAHGRMKGAQASTPALALCIATLKAVAAQPAA